MTMHSSPAVGGQPRLFLQLEGGALLAVATAFYAWGGAPWWIFALLFFAPDLAFLTYFAGPRVGAFTYNVMHTTLAPAILIGMAVLYEYPAFATIGAAIWGAHTATTACWGMASNTRSATNSLTSANSGGHLRVAAGYRDAQALNPDKPSWQNRVPDPVGFCRVLGEALPALARIVPLPK
jgi:Domain of unknown function (DUF4260)